MQPQNVFYAIMFLLALFLPVCTSISSEPGLQQIHYWPRHELPMPSAGGPNTLRTFIAIVLNLLRSDLNIPVPGVWTQFPNGSVTCVQRPGILPVGFDRGWQIWAENLHRFFSTAQGLLPRLVLDFDITNERHLKLAKIGGTVAISAIGLATAIVLWKHIIYPGWQRVVHPYVVEPSWQCVFKPYVVTPARNYILKPTHQCLQKCWERMRKKPGNN